MKTLGIMSIISGLVFFIMDFLPRQYTGSSRLKISDIQSIGYIGIVLVFGGLVVIAIDHIKGKDKRQ